MNKSEPLFITQKTVNKFFKKGDPHTVLVVKPEKEEIIEHGHELLSFQVQSERLRVNF